MPGTAEGMPCVVGEAEQRLYKAALTDLCTPSDVSDSQRMFRFKTTVCG